MAFNLAEDVPLSAESPLAAPVTRAARQLSTGRCAHAKYAKQEDTPRRRLGQLQQRERLSPVLHAASRVARSERVYSSLHSAWC